MITFIDAQKGTYGLEPRSGSSPICRLLPIAPSTYHEHASHGSDPDRTPDRLRRDADLCRDICRVFEENFAVYGVRKMWRQMLREGIAVARCTVPS